MSDTIKTVLAFGTYDLLHPGHEWFLGQAAALGDRLVVVVARDGNVERIKGRRPVHSEEERQAAVAALPMVAEARLGYVDFAKRLQVLADVQPDVIALGYDQQATLPVGQWQVVRLGVFQPDRYKSSLLRESMGQDLAKSDPA